MFPQSAKIPMIRAYYMAIILLKTWWWSFPRRRHRLCLATHPCPDLLFKGCWSGSQHVLSSRERDLTGNREKTEKKHSHLPRALYDFLLTWLWTTERKNPPGIKWRGKKKLSEMYSCIFSTNSLHGFVACFGTSAATLFYWIMLRGSPLVYLNSFQVTGVL